MGASDSTLISTNSIISTWNNIVQKSSTFCIGDTTCVQNFNFRGKELRIIDSRIFIECNQSGECLGKATFQTELVNNLAQAVQQELQQKKGLFDFNLGLLGNNTTAQVSSLIQLYSNIFQENMNKCESVIEARQKIDFNSDLTFFQNVELAISANNVFSCVFDSKISSNIINQIRQETLQKVQQSSGLDTGAIVAIVIVIVVILIIVIVVPLVIPKK